MARNHKLLLKPVALLISIMYVLKDVRLIESSDPLHRDNQRYSAPDKGHVAEWQWEQWSEQVLSDQVNSNRGPGARLGSSLWYDHSAASWWLFGGRQAPSAAGNKPGHKQQLKIYSDLWRYNASSRAWNRIFPNDNRQSNIGGMVLLRTSLFNDARKRKASATTTATSTNAGVVLCGRNEGEGLDERSLAVYGPRSTKSDTVWQLELKEKLWTAYLCCCDRLRPSTDNKTRRTNKTDKQNYGNVTTRFDQSNKPTDNNNSGHSNASNISLTRIKYKHANKTSRKNKLDMSGGGLISNESIDNLSSPNVTFQQTNKDEFLSNPCSNETKDGTRLEKGKENQDNSRLRHDTELKRSEAQSNGTASDCNEDSEDDRSDVEVPEGGKTLDELVFLRRNGSTDDEDLETTSAQPSTASVDGGQQRVTSDGDERRRLEERDVSRPGDDLLSLSADTSPAPQAFCPDFEDGLRGQPMAWCDTRRELLVALDLKASPLTLWQFDLKKSHWFQKRIAIDEGTLWPGCASNSSGIRYASSGSSIYILCPPYGETNATSTRLVYKIDAGKATLEALGQLQLHVLFGDKEGSDIWVDESLTVLHTVDLEYNKTLLLIAYNQLLDIWVLDRHSGHKFFVPVENIWRGSALKWFRDFNSPFYNLQIADQSWLLPNPRQVNRYWPRERGRFIIRLMEHGDNTTAVPVKEQLHTLEMIKNGSDNPNNNAAMLPHHQGGQDGVKALLFFTLSLSMFAMFGVILFIRRCVTCPPQSWRMRDDINKPMPPVIRYSVIPDDLAYPVA